jgi:hypothetical protein
MTSLKKRREKTAFSSSLFAIWTGKVILLTSKFEYLSNKGKEHFMKLKQVIFIQTHTGEMIKGDLNIVENSCLL